MNEPTEEESGLLRALQAEESWSNSYLRAELSEAHISAMKRYYGDEYGDEVEGLSRVTTREVYETIEWLRPDLKRVFVSGERVCEFEGVNEQGDQYADQASDYVNFLFLIDNPGERVLDEFIFDGLLHRRGVIAAEWKEAEYTPAQETSGLNTMQAQQLLQMHQQGQIQIVAQDVEEGPPDEAHPDGAFYSFKIKNLTNDAKPEIFTIAPEDFRIAARSVDLKTARYCGDIIRMMKGEAKAKWPDFEEEIDSHQGESSTFSVDDRRAERFRDVEGWDSTSISRHDDGEAAEVEIQREYIRYDLDDDGYPELIRCYRLGSTLLEYEEVDEHIYSSWTPIPIPHRFYGLSIADEAADLQRTKTVLLRSMLNSVYLSNAPRMVAKEGVNLDDLLNVTPGAVIRDNSAPGVQGVTPLMTPDLSGSSLQAMQWVDKILVSRTGVTREAQGMDPDILHDTARGVELMQNAQSVRKEEIARNLADGLQDFFAKLYRLVHKHQNVPRAVKIAGKWDSIDPRGWEAQMRCTVSVGLGTGAREKQLMMLGILQGDQAAAVANFGPQNPSVSPMELYNMVAEKCRVLGFKSPDRFFKRPIDPKTGQPWMPQPQPSPEQQKLQAQVQEGQARLQLDAQKAQQDMQVKQFETQAKAGSDAQKATMDAEIAKMKAEGELQLQLQKMQAEMAIKREQMAFEAQMKMQQFAFEKEMAEREFEVKSEVMRKQADAKAKVNGSANGSSGVSSTKFGGDPG